MAVHPSGDGVAWVQNIDIDQPHGLDYRAWNHLAIAIRSRMKKGHLDFSDSTIGGEHIPGCGILGWGDGTPTVDGTFHGRGVVYDGTGILWCSSSTGEATTCDYTIMKMHPDWQWDGGDITWTGGHEFDASVDITGAVTLYSDLTVMGNAEFSDVDITGDVSVWGAFYVDSSVDVSEFHVEGDASLDGDLVVDGTCEFNGNVDVSADLDVSGALSVSGDASNAAFAVAWGTFCANGGAGDLGAGDFTGYNITTIQKAGTGYFEISFADDLAHVNYAAFASFESDATNSIYHLQCMCKGTDGFAIGLYNNVGTYADTTQLHFVVFA